MGALAVICLEDMSVSKLTVTKSHAKPDWIEVQQHLIGLSIAMRAM